MGSVARPSAGATSTSSPRPATSSRTPSWPWASPWPRAPRRRPTGTTSRRSTCRPTTRPGACGTPSTCELGAPETVLLRTHTSPVQIRLMESPAAADLRRDARAAATAATPPTPATCRCSTRSRGWSSTGASPSATWPAPSRRSPPPSSGPSIHSRLRPVLLPLHRAVGRVRRHLPDLRRRRLPDLLRVGLDRARRLRDGRPQRVRRGRRSTPRTTAGSPSASGSTAWPRSAPDLADMRTCSTTTSASCPVLRTSAPMRRPALLAPRLRPVRPARRAAWPHPVRPRPGGRGRRRVGGASTGVVVARDPRHPDPSPTPTGSGWSTSTPATASRSQIVCGAWNFAVGDLVPWPPSGPCCPTGMEIARRKMRGEWSNGMLCSAGELEPARPDGADGLLILPPGLAAPGHPAGRGPGHRAPTWCSTSTSAQPARRPVHGRRGPGPGRRARACRSRLPTHPAGADASTPAVEAAPPCGSTTADLCPRFTATVITGVPVGPSPRVAGPAAHPGRHAAHQQRGRRLQLRDARPRPTQPRLRPRPPRRPRAARPPGPPRRDHRDPGRRGRAAARTLATPATTVLICDAAATPVGRRRDHGRRRGGDLRPHDPRAARGGLVRSRRPIARTGKRLGLRTEARHRFERGVDPEIADAAVDRFVGSSLAATRPAAPDPVDGPTVDVRSDADLPPTGRALRTARVNAILGTDLDDERGRRLLGPDRVRRRAGAPPARWVTVPIPSACPTASARSTSSRRWPASTATANIARTVPPGARPAAV